VRYDEVARGVILADNGSPWFINGISDRRWNDDDMGLPGRISGGDLEVVDTSSLRNGPVRAGGPRTPHRRQG